MLTHRPRVFVAIAAGTVGLDLVVSSLFASYVVSVTVLFSLGAVYALAQTLGALLFIRNAREVRTRRDGDRTSRRETPQRAEERRTPPSRCPTSSPPPP